MTNRVSRRALSVQCEIHTQVESESDRKLAAGLLS